MTNTQSYLKDTFDEILSDYSYESSISFSNGNCNSLLKLKKAKDICNNDINIPYFSAEASVFYPTERSAEFVKIIIENFPFDIDAWKQKIVDVCEEIKNKKGL